jgi:guanine nucleotide-binding protein subunit alpha
MGGCLSNRPKPLPPQTLENTVKILCIGVGGCGKTTFVKALKIINNVPWKETEIQAFIKAMRANYVKGIQDALEGVKKLGLALKPENEGYAKEMSIVRASTEMNEENYTALQELWKDPAIQCIVEKHGELLSVTHLNYIWIHVDRIMDPNFIPNNEDILRVRVRTSGANSSTIFIDKVYHEFFDVGGQRPERSKWEYVFKENQFNSIIYFVATDEFDVVENEDKDNARTKLEISRYIFSELIHSDMVDSEIPVVLFLNRSDLFNNRIQNAGGFHAFQNTFKNYNGPQDSAIAMNHLRDYFLAVAEQDVNIKTYVTCALDRNGLVMVWRTVNESIMNKTLKQIFL